MNIILEKRLKIIHITLELAAILTAISLQKIVNRKTLPNIIYANGDDTAAGIIYGLKELGFINNIDYKVIGEGNMPYSELLGFSTIDFYQKKLVYQ